MAADSRPCGSTYFEPDEAADFQLHHFGARAIDETTRQYMAACANGHYVLAAYWSRVLRALYLRAGGASEGTVWDIATPTEAAEAIAAEHGLDRAVRLVQDATAGAELEAHSRFWWSAHLWLTCGALSDAPEVAAQ